MSMVFKITRELSQRCLHLAGRLSHSCFHSFILEILRTGRVSDTGHLCYGVRQKEIMADTA